MSDPSDAEVRRAMRWFPPPFIRSPLRRDDVMTWPVLRIQAELAPWHWRIVPRFYRDDVRWWEVISAEWLFIKVEWMCNTPPFTRDGAA